MYSWRNNDSKVRDVGNILFQANHCTLVCDQNPSVHERKNALFVTYLVMLIYLQQKWVKLGKIASQSRKRLYLMITFQIGKVSTSSERGIYYTILTWWRKNMKIYCHLYIRSGGLKRINPVLFFRTSKEKRNTFLKEMCTTRTPPQSLNTPVR